MNNSIGPIIWSFYADFLYFISKEQRFWSTSVCVPPKTEQMDGWMDEWLAFRSAAPKLRSKRASEEKLLQLHICWSPVHRLPESCYERDALLETSNASQCQRHCISGRLVVRPIRQYDKAIQIRFDEQPIMTWSSSMRWPLCRIECRSIVWLHYWCTGRSLISQLHRVYGGQRSRGSCHASLTPLWWPVLCCAVMCSAVQCCQRCAQWLHRCHHLTSPALRRVFG